jgi:hypothetical protein
MGLQFSSHVRGKHGGGFDFQLIFATFTNGLKKITQFYLQTDTCAQK